VAREEQSLHEIPGMSWSSEVDSVDESLNEEATSKVQHNDVTKHILSVWRLHKSSLRKCVMAYVL